MMALDSVPIWCVTLLIVGALSISVEIGYRVGLLRQRRCPDEKEQVVGTMVGATLGLLAFLLAFTFGLAASRFEEKRTLVLKEANAIGTTYLRSELLPSSTTAIQQELRDYVEDRLEVIETRDTKKLLAHAEQSHRQLWEKAIDVSRQSPDSLMVSLFVQSLNEVIDVHAERVLIGLRSRLPLVLWIALGSLALLAMAGVGYQEGVTKSRRSLAVIMLMFSFSAIASLIIDLDRPQDGFLRVSQQPLIDLKNSMNQNAATEMNAGSL